MPKNINEENNIIDNIEDIKKINSYIPNFSIVEQIRKALIEVEFKFENPRNIETADKFKQTFITVFEDNLTANEEEYAKYLTENETKIMELINAIQYYDSDQWAEWNGARIELITALNMGITPLFFDEDSELYFY